MHIHRVVDIKGDNSCSYRVVSALLGKGMESQTLFHLYLIKEFKTYKESYTRLYGKKEQEDEIHNALIL